MRIVLVKLRNVWSWDIFRDGKFKATSGSKSWATPQEALANALAWLEGEAEA